MLIDELSFPVVILDAKKSEYISIDTETSGLNVRNNEDYLMGVCISADGDNYYIPYRHTSDNITHDQLMQLFEVLEDKNLIWHNRKFDMHSIRTTGYDPLKFTGNQFDTMILAHLENEERFSFELDVLGKQLVSEGKHGADYIKTLAELKGYENITPEEMHLYGIQDVVVTKKLFYYLWKQLETQELQELYLTTEQPFTTLLYQMEQRGVGVNTEFAETKARIGRARMASIMRKLRFNPASPNDLKKVLIEDLGLPVIAHTSSCELCKKKLPVETHEGKASFNKRAMEEYDDILKASNNPTAKLIAEYRGWQKAVTSLYEPLLRKVGHDGYIRTQFKQTGTVTGRLSANDPNLQQIPKGSSNVWNGDAKSAFNSGRDGFSLVGWDYSQLELRLASAYGQEQRLIDEFSKEDSDPFSLLAPQIFGELTPETRQDTKTFVYANLYGAGVAKIAMQLGRTVEETEQLYQNYKKSIKGIMAISQKVAQLAEQRKFIRYWDGRRRHIRNRRDSYKAWNSLCQGGGAQLVKKAMLRCREFEDDNCFMVLQVHDEITFCIRTDMIDYYEPKIIEAMTDWPLFGVNFAVDGKEWK